MAALLTVASAETRGTLRVSLLPLDLEASSDTALFGDKLDDAVAGYNLAAAAHDRASGDRTRPIGAGDLGVTETLLVLSPGIEVDSGRYLFRLEAPIGLAGDLRSIGVGIYPLGVQTKLRRDLVVYASAGGTASWLDRPGDGDVGGLFTVRAAVGVRIASYLIVELGYHAFALGGSVNTTRLENMTVEDLAMPLPAPSSLVSAGEARGLVDVSVGVAF